MRQETWTAKAANSEVAAKIVKLHNVVADAMEGVRLLLTPHNAHLLREVRDKDGNSVLQFWATAKGLVVTQIFQDTGDVVWLVSTQDVEGWLNGND